MEQYLELISVPAIAAIVYWIIALLKYAVKENETFKRFIPIIAAVLGAVFGVVAFYALPSIIPAPNVVVAIIIGGASGLTATGANQIIKQLSQKKEENATDDSGGGEKDEGGGQE